MKSHFCIIAAALAAATLLLAQDSGNVKTSLRTDRLNGVSSAAEPSNSAGARQSHLIYVAATPQEAAHHLKEVLK